MSGPSYQHVLHELAARRRVLLLGGVAIILHGLSRATEDADIWLDPQPVEAWAGELRAVLASHPDLRWLRLTSAGWVSPGGATLEEAAVGERVVRLVGTDRPVDVFHVPNELADSDFEPVWQRARPTADGLRYLEEIDLLLTKQSTGREKDDLDVRFLESKINAEYLLRLRDADASEAKSLLARYATPVLLKSLVLESQNAEVQALAHRLLSDLEGDGDPFAAEYLRELEATYSAAPPR